MPIVGKCLNAGIFSDSQWACLIRMTSFCLFLCRCACKGKARLFHRQTASHSGFPASEIITTFHVFPSDIFRKISPVATLRNERHYFFLDSGYDCPSDSGTSVLNRSPAKNASRRVLTCVQTSGHLKDTNGAMSFLIAIRINRSRFCGTLY